MMDRYRRCRRPNARHAEVSAKASALLDSAKASARAHTFDCTEWGPLKGRNSILVKKEEYLAGSTQLDSTRHS
ncbi:unnamed protein product [Sphagnum balticum]